MKFILALSLVSALSPNRQASVPAELGTSPATPTQVTTSRASVVVYDQMARLVPGVPVRVERGTGGNGSPADLVTQQSGQTKTVTIPTNNPLIITLGEKDLKDGTALGVMHVVDGANPPIEAVSHNQLYNLSMPHAATVELNSKQSAKLKQPQIGAPTTYVDYSEVVTDPTEGAWPLWDICIPPYTTVFTSLSIASLVNNWDISGRLLYGGASQLNASDYQTGLEMLIHTQTFLGEPGITLHISSPAYNFLAKPNFDIVGFDCDNLELLAAEPIAWSHQTLAIRLSGTLPKGRIIFLLRESGNSAVTRFNESYSPPTIPITSESYENQSLACEDDFNSNPVAVLANEDTFGSPSSATITPTLVKTCACVPTEPGAQHRTIPSPGAGLGFTARVRNYLNGDCDVVLVEGPTNDVVTTLISQGGCGNVGSTNAEHQSTSTSTTHKIPVHAEYVAPGGSNGGGGYEYEYAVTHKSTTIKAHDYQAGNGDGECISYYEHHFSSLYVYDLMQDARQEYQRYLGDGWWVWDERDVPCALPYKRVHVLAGATATDTSQCPRTTVPDDQECPQ